MKQKNGRMIWGGVDLVELAETLGTPLYVIDEEVIRDRFRQYRAAFPDAEIAYAVKANNSLAVLRILAQEGSGADVFSDGELYMALAAGIPAEKILFNGNSKSDWDLTMAKNTGVRVSVDSLDELEVLSRMFPDPDNPVEIAFRVNPDVRPDTHHRIATGVRESEFGIPYEMVLDAYGLALTLPGVKPVGICCHIGSQITDTSVFAETAHKMMGLARELLEIYDLELGFVDLGGGLGIDYTGEGKAPSPKDLAEAIMPEYEAGCAVMGYRPKLILEPGRSIVAESTVLLTRVNFVKEAGRLFAGIDAGFNVLIRPTLYSAYHRIIVANKANQAPARKYTVVGPMCETDIMAEERPLPELARGDLLAFLDAGAYGFSMSSQYNGRPRPAEVLVRNGEWYVIRDRESYSDLLLRQRVPSHLLLGNPPARFLPVSDKVRVPEAY
jgi:diaminopimelate decarboxylase